MLLSNSGRVVLIDDKFEEAKPLIETFSKHNIPFLYFDGVVDNLPEKPIEGIRFVFLDISLKGMDGANDKSKASTLMGVLSKIISDINGPYTMIFWTKNKDAIDQVLKNCAEASISPITHLDLEKYDLMNDGNTYDLAAIEELINRKLKSIGSFALYVNWENVLNSASRKFVNKFASHIPPGEKWSSNTSTLFYKLYKAYADKQSIDNPDEQFKCACHLMNRSFLDTLEHETMDSDNLPGSFKLTNGGNLKGAVIAKLNSSLFIGDNLLRRPTTGGVYQESYTPANEYLLESLKNTVFKASSTPDNCLFCKIIVTPECDVAQNKLLRSAIEKKAKLAAPPLHRVVYGVYFEIDPEELEKEINKIKGNGAAFFKIGPFCHENKFYYLTIHFGTLSFQPENLFPEKSLFNLQRDLLFDLQSKAANHVNRLGNYMLK